MLRMKHERLRRGWNQTALAFHAGLSATDVSQIETGRLRPYPRQIQRLAAALGLDTDVLLEHVDDPSAQVAQSARG